MNLSIKTGSPKGAGFPSKNEFVDVAKKFGFMHDKINNSKVLVTDDLNSTTGKMAKAAKMNDKNPGSIEVLSYEQFLDKYCKGFRPVDTTDAPVVKSDTKALF